MVLDALLAQLLNGLTIGMVYVLLAAGLSIVFGVMDVINFAHGELFALGAYFAVSIAGAAGGAGFWVALVAAPLLVAAIGSLVERYTIRPLYGRNPLYHILLTFGLVLVTKDLIELVWGRQRLSLATPELLSGPVELFGFSYSLYNYFVILVGAVIAGGTWLLLRRTRYGVVVRAGAQDRAMVRHLGVDVDRYYTLVFAFGALLAAVAGIVLGAKQNVALGMGDSVIIPAFVVVVLGGLGSFRGAVVGGLLIGVVETFSRSYLPQLEGLVVFLLMIGVLLARPQGLFGNPEWQRNEAGGDLLAGGGSSLLPATTRRLKLGLVAALVLAPLGIGTLYSSYYVNSLLVHVLVWAIFALSLDLVMGYTGLVSLGHVLFYGLGAYGTVLTVRYVTPSFPVALVAGVGLAAAVAWAVGHLSIRVAGVYFAMITLGFAELFYQGVIKLGFTGGSDGLFREFEPVYGPGLPEVGQVEPIPGIEAELFYYLALVAAVGCYLLARRLMAAPFGGVLRSIRESEERSRFVGYDTTAYKRTAFTISGGLGGLAGGLAAALTGGVAPSFLHWLKSGEVIVMTILGGMGTLYGPMLGAGVYFGLKEVLLSFTEQWQGVLGLVFVLVVVFVPEGLVSLPGLVSERLDRAGSGDEEAPEVAD